jgi:seryl-tRNA synthetase
MTNQRELYTVKQLAEAKLQRELVQHGLLIPCAVPGVYGRSGVFEDVLARFGELVSRLSAEDGATQLHFPPVISRAVLERAEYLESFPQLAGLVFSFQGDECDHLELVARVRGERSYAELQSMTQLALTPAACHALYPTCSGQLPADGKLVELTSYCFRHEPSADPARMQMFRMREHVRLGTPSLVRSWRTMWLKRGHALLASLGLHANASAANDPFFGRGGRLLAANQREQQLKLELLYPITSEAHPTALMSLNYHRDHFARLYGIETRGDQLAHTACIGFGLERVAIALFKTHGFDPSHWPGPVRRQLGWHPSAVEVAS